MSTLDNILKATTQAQLQVYSSPTVYLNKILALTYGNTYIDYILEFANSVDYSAYTVNSTSTVVSPILTVSETQSKIIRTTVASDLLTNSPNTLNPPIFVSKNESTSATSNLFFNYLQNYNYSYISPSLIKHTNNYVQGFVKQITQYVYNITTEAQFYLLDKNALQKVWNFSIMPDENDPFYTQKVILLYVYNAPSKKFDDYEDARDLSIAGLVINIVTALFSSTMFVLSFFTKERFSLIKLIYIVLLGVCAVGLVLSVVFYVAIFDYGQIVANTNLSYETYVILGSIGVALGSLSFIVCVLYSLYSYSEPIKNTIYKIKNRKKISKM